MWERKYELIVPISCLLGEEMRNIEGIERKHLNGDKQRRMSEEKNEE